MNTPKFLLIYEYGKTIAGFKWWVNKVNKHDLYIEGRNGYATGDGKLFWVTITVKKYMLRTPDFTDMAEEQTLPCGVETLEPLLEIIKPYADHAENLRKAPYLSSKVPLQSVETIKE